MRKNLFLAGLAAVTLTTSCSEDFDLLGNKHEVTLGVSVSAEGTRAAFLSDGSFYWSSGDQIGVTTTNLKTSFAALDLTTGAGTATATFKGTVSGDVTNDCYAIYPYNDGHSIATADGATTLTYNYPTTYTYTKVDQTYFPENKDGNSFNPAMWAKVTDSGVTFKYLSGVFCIYVEKVPYASGTLTVAADENLAGKFTAKLSDTETPTCVNTEGNPTDASKTVTITFSGATVNSPGVFYVPAPVGKYNNVTLTFTQDSNTKVIKAGYFEIKRKGLKKLEIKEATIDAGTTTAVENASAATTALESNDNVAVTEITAESGTAAAITIPAVTSSSEATEETPTVAENTQKTVTVEKIAESAKIELKDAATSTTETQTKSSVESVTLSIPNMPAESDDEKGKLPQVTVSLPNSTVTLAGNAGAANFGTVTAAENTLVVSSGVTIQKLIVKKGNVRIEKGATVVAIEKDASYTGGTPIIYVEDGASYPSDLSDFTVKKASFIDTESDFESAMSKGGESFMLTKNLTLSRDYTTGQNVTVIINLNGKTLTTTNLIRAVGGNLTLNNGSITQNANAGSGMNVGTNGVLSVDHVKYTGLSGHDGFFVENCSQKAKLNISNSTANVQIYGVTTNATTTPTVAKDCEINLSNSTFTAKETGVLINIPAKVTMTNCTFSGNHQGGFLRGGTYTISGCTFTLNAELTVDNAENNWGKTWQGGNEGAFAALTIGNYLNTAYQYPTNITFSGTNTATVTGTNASSFPAIHVCANAAEGKGVTITNLNNITKSGGKTEVEYGTSNITVDSADPVSYITDDSSFTSAMSKGGIYVLKDNVTLSNEHTTTEGKTIAIDLNGKTLTTTNLIRAVGGNLTLNNGSITQNANAGSGMNVGTNGVLSVDHVKYTGLSGHDGFFVENCSQKAKLNISNSTANVQIYGVTTNATTTPTVAKDCEINLSNSTFTAKETGVLINIPAKVTMTNCTFSGNHQGGFLRGGTYTISGCTFTLNAELAVDNAENNWGKTWKGGNEGAFAALTIGNHLNGSYQYATNITFTGKNYAKVTGTNASSFPAMHVCANATDGIGVTITGMSNVTKSGGKSQSVEYGTTNITVDGNTVATNISKTE